MEKFEPSTVLPNIERPFTEIFSLLESREANVNGSVKLAYSRETINMIYQHSENAMSTLLLGIQSIGKLLNHSIRDTSFLSDHLSDIGTLISALGNLTEAIDNLRSNTEHELNS